jgi:hypothetical protein
VAAGHHCSRDWCALLQHALNDAACLASRTDACGRAFGLPMNDHLKEHAQIVGNDDWRCLPAGCMAALEVEHFLNETM